MPKKVENIQVNKKLNLKNDIIFKAFFSRKGNEKYLIDFLNSILKIEITNIEIKEEVNLEQFSKKEKGGRLDIQAILNDGMIVNIEMQMKNLNNMEERNDVYESKTISRHFPRGGEYEDAKEVIAIYILNYNLFGFDDEDRGRIEMAKEKNDVIKQAEVEIRYFTADEEARYLADMRDLWESDRNSELGHAKRKEEKERNGKTEWQNGKKETKIEIVKEMIKNNMTIEMIEKITHITKEEIEKIQKEIKDVP